MKILFLPGGVSGGLWRSTDQGSTWSKSTTLSDIQSITCIAQDTRSGHTDTWYYGTGEQEGNSANGSDAFFLGDGIFKSIDNGLTWNVLPATEQGSPQVLSGEFEINHQIIVNPSNGDVLVATFFGIYRSKDGGTTFTQVLNSIGRGWSGIVTTSTGGVLYASIEDQGQGIFKSIDNGDSWMNITAPGFPLANLERIEMAIAPSNEYILYTLSEDGSKSALWKYDDSTGTWEDRSDNIPMLGGFVGNFDSQRGYNLLIKVKPEDENFVIIGGTNLYRSTDGFASKDTSTTNWVGGYSPENNVSLYTNQHPDQHAFLFLSGTKALSGNDGGVQITNDITDVDANADGETVDWTDLSNGYLTTQVYALSIGSGDQIMAGFQDNSTWLTTSSNGTTFWSDQSSGDGAYNAFSSDGKERYVSSQNAVIYRQSYSNADDETEDAYQYISPSNGGYTTSLFITPFYLDPANDEILYLGGNKDLYVNTKANTSTDIEGWKSISLPDDSGVISEFGLTNAGVVYVGTDFGELYKIDNPESDAPVVSSNIAGSIFPSDGYISSIGVNQMDVNELIVTFSNYGVVSIFHSINGGTSWTDISGNLEENVDGSGSGPSVRAVRIFGNGSRYLVGTSTGLYSTKVIDGSNTIWTLEGNSTIGNVVVNHIVSRNNDGLVVVGTHGNGLYSADFSYRDLEVTSIDAPVTTVFTNLSDVSITITNNGNLDHSNFNVTLTIDEKLIVTDNISTIINPSSSLSHTFSSQFDFKIPGTYEVKVSISLAEDAVSANDVLIASISNLVIPTDIALSNRIIAEEEASGTSIGILTTTDGDDDTAHIYSLVTGEGGDDNASFSIASSELISGEVFDFETKPAYTIRIQTEDDDGNTFAKSFSIEVTDVTAVEDLENIGITMFPNPFKDRINLEMVNDYIGQIEVELSSLDGKKILIEKSYYKRKKKTSSLLDLSHISSGSYIIKFRLDGKEIISKLIKE